MTRACVYVNGDCVFDDVAATTPCPFTLTAYVHQYDQSFVHLSAEERCAKLQEADELHRRTYADCVHCVPASPSEQVLGEPMLVLVVLGPDGAHGTLIGLRVGDRVRIEID